MLRKRFVGRGGLLDERPVDAVVTIVEPYRHDCVVVEKAHRIVDLAVSVLVLDGRHARDDAAPRRCALAHAPHQFATDARRVELDRLVGALDDDDPTERRDQSIVVDLVHILIVVVVVVVVFREQIIITVADVVDVGVICVVTCVVVDVVVV